MVRQPGEAKTLGWKAKSVGRIANGWLMLADPMGPIAARVCEAQKVPNLRHCDGRSSSPLLRRQDWDLLGPHDRWRVPLSDQHILLGRV